MTAFLVAVTVLVAIAVVYTFSLDIRAQIWFRSVHLFYLKLEDRYLRWRIGRANAKEEKMRRQIAEAQEDADAHPHP